jgi:hypothetical protein
MSLRDDIHALRRRLGTPGDCPGVLQGLMTTYRQGQPEPEAPLCELCGEAHWPKEHQVVCEVIIRSRDEARQFFEAQTANGASSPK